MNILLVMIPLSILLALGAGIAFFWAVDHDQFDDLDTPKLLPLLDDPPAPASREEGGVEAACDENPSDIEAQRRADSREENAA